jgi:hypothetical protein
MQRVKLPIPLGFYQSESLPLDAQRCINWIPTIPQNEALNGRALIQVPGLKKFSEPNIGTCRGGRVMAGVPFFVQGSNLISVSSSGVSTILGSIDGSKRVVMADNGTTLVIVVPGGKTYVWDGSTVTEITDPDFQVSMKIHPCHQIFHLLHYLSSNKLSFSFTLRISTNAASKSSRFK